MEKEIKNNLLTDSKPEISGQGSAHTKSNTPDAFAKSKKKSRTAGWVAFDAISYIGLGFLGNVGVSLVLAKDEMNFGNVKSYKEQHNGSLRGYKGSKSVLPEGFHNLNGMISEKSGALYTSGLKKLGYKSQDAKIIGKKGGGFTGSIALLSWGGTALFIPIYFMERAKPALVRNFDKAIDAVRHIFGKGPDEAEMAERAKTYQYLDSKQAKEPFSKLLVSRYFSVGVVVAGAVASLLVDPARRGISRIGDMFLSVGQIFSIRRTERGEEPLSWVPADLNIHKLRSHDDAENTSELGKLNFKQKTALAFASVAAVEIFGSGVTAVCAYLKIKFSELTGKRQKEFEKESTAAGASLKDKAEGETSPSDAEPKRQWTKEYESRKSAAQQESERAAPFATAAARLDASRQQATVMQGI